MLRMDKVYVIRHKVLVEGQSGRSVARELGISRNTVAKYLQTSEPVREPEAASRPRPVTDRIAPRIDEILSEWAGRVTPKQRITASRIHRQLLKENFPQYIQQYTIYPAQYIRHLTQHSEIV